MRRSVNGSPGGTTRRSICSSRGGKDELYKEENASRGGLQYHSLRVDPRGGSVELFGQNYKVMFKVVSDQAKDDRDGKPRQGAQTPLSPAQLRAEQEQRAVELERRAIIEAIQLERLQRERIEKK